MTSSNNNIMSADDIASLVAKTGDSSRPAIKSLQSIEDLQKYLVKKEERIQEYRGMFTQESHALSFFNDKNGETILHEIKKITYRQLK
ncbi:MAG: hypothetical protein KC646_13780 [Candidatus Cloacimonetes bacterium]|nr:hypothetical protein [Candidatus Cloacimonadota bacterium]